MEVCHLYSSQPEPVSKSVREKCLHMFISCCSLTLHSCDKTIPYHSYEEVNWWQTSGWSMATAVSSSTMLVATMMADTPSSEAFAVMLTVTIAALSGSEAIC